MNFGLEKTLSRKSNVFLVSIYMLVEEKKEDYDAYYLGFTS